MDWYFISGVLTGAIVTYLLWPGGVLFKRKTQNFRITLDRPLTGIIDLTKDQTIEMSFEYRAPRPGAEVSTEDFIIPEYLEDNE